MTRRAAVALALIVSAGCSPRPAVVRCRNTGTRFDAPGGAKAWVGVDYHPHHAAFSAYASPDTYVGRTMLPTGFCDVEWLP